MWKYFLICAMVGVASCSGTKGNSDGAGADEGQSATIAAPDIQGQWLIENVVENDSSYVRPSEIESGVTAYIDFKEDDTFGIMTNCNHLGGQYSQSNDSIHLTNISATEMACDNMEVEDMLKKVLPSVNTVDCINDSITRLNTDKGESYIVLKKVTKPLK